MFQEINLPFLPTAIWNLYSISIHVNILPCNLLEIVLEVMEGLIRGGYYLDSIFNPSAVDRNAHTFIVNQ